jgi:hypothetical protein
MKQFKPSTSIHDLIQKEFDIDLPISSGTGLSVDDPIVMNIDVDYVQNEFEALKFMGYFRSIKWKRMQQKLFNIGDRYIDCITIKVTDLMDFTSDSWTEEYFFDVTDSLEMISTLLDSHQELG